MKNIILAMIGSEKLFY